MDVARGLQLWKITTITNNLLARQQEVQIKVKLKIDLHVKFLLYLIFQPKIWKPLVGKSMA